MHFTADMEHWSVFVLVFLLTSMLLLPQLIAWIPWVCAKQWFIACLSSPGKKRLLNLLPVRDCPWTPLRFILLLCWILYLYGYLQIPGYQVLWWGRSDSGGRLEYWAAGKGALCRKEHGKEILLVNLPLPLPQHWACGLTLQEDLRCSFADVALGNYTVIATYLQTSFKSCRHLGINYKKS